HLTVKSGATNYSVAPVSNLKTTSLGVEESQQAPACASRLLHSALPSRRSSAKARNSAALSDPSYPYSSSLRFESLCASQRSDPLARPDHVPADPDKPWQLPTATAIRSSAGSAHSAQTLELRLLHRSHSASKTLSGLAQTHPARERSLKHKCDRCTNKPTSRRPVSAYADRSDLDRNKQSQPGAKHR